MWLVTHVLHDGPDDEFPYVIAKCLFQRITERSSKAVAFIMARAPHTAFESIEQICISGVPAIMLTPLGLWRVLTPEQPARLIVIMLISSSACQTSAMLPILDEGRDGGIPLAMPFAIPPIRVFYDVEIDLSLHGAQSQT